MAADDDDSWDEVATGVTKQREQVESAPSGQRANAADGAAARQWIAEIARGDERALSRLYDRYSSPLNGVALRMLKDPVEAEEVLEQTFWQVWRTAERYDPERGSPFAWLVTITRSRALDRLRAIRRGREDAVELLPQPTVECDFLPTPSNPNVDTEMRQRREILHSAFKELPPEQWQAMMLAYFLGFSQSEIAERLQTPLGTVKTRVRLGLARLRESLSRLGPDGRGAL